MTVVFVPRSRQTAKIAMIIGVALFAVSVLIYVAMFGETFIKQSTWISTPAIVTDYDETDPRNVWTEFTYQVDGHDRTVRLAGHSYWMHEGDSIDLLRSPDDPQKIEVNSYVNIHRDSAIAFPIVFGGIMLLYLAFFVYWRRKEPKAERIRTQGSGRLSRQDVGASDAASTFEEEEARLFERR